MINLIPNASREEHVYGRRNRRLAALVLLIAFAAISVVAIMYISVGFVSSEQANVQKEIDDNKLVIAKLESQTNEVDKVAARLDTTYRLFEKSIKFSEIVPEIGSLLPTGTIIDGLSLTGGSTDPLALSVSATSPDLIPVLQKNLVESEIFEAADVISITPGGSAENYNYSASVSVSFTGSADAKKKEAAAAAAAKAAKDAEGSQQ